MNKKIVVVCISLGVLFFVSILIYLKQFVPEDKIAHKNIIKIAGSESERKLIDHFKINYESGHDSTVLHLTGGGSGLGIQALMFDTIDIANSSRPLTQDEILKSQSYNIKLIPFIIGVDVVAIISNHNVSIESLSINELGKIFSGEIKNWKELNGGLMPIKLFGRDANSGTKVYIKNRFLIEEFADSIRSMHDNLEIINAVKNEKGAIGYISIGSIGISKEELYKNVNVVNVYFEGGNPHSPFDKDVVRVGDYPLIRPLYQIVKHNTNERIIDYLNFEMSDEQQVKIEQIGFYPITPIYKELNKINFKKLEQVNSKIMK